MEMEKLIEEIESYKISWLLRKDATQGYFIHVYHDDGNGVSVNDSIFKTYAADKKEALLGAIAYLKNQAFWFAVQEDKIRGV